MPWKGRKLWQNTRFSHGLLFNVQRLEGASGQRICAFRGTEPRLPQHSQAQTGGSAEMKTGAGWTFDSSGARPDGRHRCAAGQTKRGEQQSGRRSELRDSRLLTMTMACLHCIGAAAAVSTSNGRRRRPSRLTDSHQHITSISHHAAPASHGSDRPLIPLLPCAQLSCSAPVSE